MARYPNNLFEILGVSEDIGLKAIGKLPIYERNILYKRWGYDLKSGDEAVQKGILSGYEIGYLREKIIPKLKYNISLIKGPKSNPVIIEKEKVKGLNAKRKFFMYISDKFKDYDEIEVSQIIFILMKSLGYERKKGYDYILEFAKQNNELILEKIKERGLICAKTLTQENSQLTTDEILWRVLQSIKDKYYQTYLLEDIIKATKIAMLRYGFKNYDNFFLCLDFVINNRFSVFRVLKTDLISKSNLLITTNLKYTNDLGEPFININYILSQYYLGIDNGYSVEEVLQILSAQFNISPQLILEFVSNIGLGLKKVL